MGIRRASGYLFEIHPTRWPENEWCRQSSVDGQDEIKFFVKEDPAKKLTSALMDDYR